MSRFMDHCPVEVHAVGVEKAQRPSVEFVFHFWQNVADQVLVAITSKYCDIVTSVA